jgi:hypothetical protein
VITLLLAGLWGLAFAGLVFGPERGLVAELCAGVFIVTTIVGPVTYLAEMAAV